VRKEQNDDSNRNRIYSMIDLFLLMKVGERDLFGWTNVFQNFSSDICKRRCNVQVKNEFTSSNINGFSHFILTNSAWFIFITNCDHPNYKYPLNSNVFLFQSSKHFQTYMNVISFSSNNSFSKFNKTTQVN